MINVVIFAHTVIILCVGNFYAFTAAHKNFPACSFCADKFISDLVFSLDAGFIPLLELNIKTELLHFPIVFVSFIVKNGIKAIELILYE